MRESERLFAEFLDYYEEERFTGGREWAKRLYRVGENPHLVAFGKAARSFFQALERIESSYRYQKAARAFGCARLRMAREAEKWGPYAGLFERFCTIEQEKLEIDRNVYNGNSARLTAAALSMKEEVRKACELFRGSFSGKERWRKRRLYLKAGRKLRALNAFSGAMYRIARSYEGRWLGSGNRYYHMYRLEILGEIETLARSGKKILAYDLKSHVVVLDFFLNLSDPSRLRVNQGSMTYIYYGVINYKIKEEFDRLIGGMESETPEFTGVKPYEEVMEDLWIGLKAKDFTKKCVWNLKPLRMENFLVDGGEALFDVELSYYNMGVFTLSLTFEIGAQKGLKRRGLSVTDYRYMLGLGNNFALDERFVFGADGSSYAFLHEFAREIFDRFNESFPALEGTLKGLDIFGDSDESILFYDDNEFVPFILSDFYDFSLQTGTKYRSLTRMKEIASSASLQGLLLNAREVRSAIDSWVLQKPVPWKNLAPLRYNADEIIRMESGEALVILPEEPDWVRHQARESVEVGSAINQLLNLNVTLYKRVIRERRDGFSEIVRTVRRDVLLGRLEGARENMELLLDMLTEGSMTQFPDHEYFMERIVENLRIEQTRARALATLEKLKSYSEKVLEEEERRRFRKVETAVALATSLLSAAAMVDIFSVINNDDFEMFHLSSYWQLAIIVVVSFVIFFATLKAEKE
ncbi:hypothetical protein [Hydrogenimonas sp.]